MSIKPTNNDNDISHHNQIRVWELVTQGEGISTHTSVVLNEDHLVSLRFRMLAYVIYFLQFIKDVKRKIIGSQRSFLLVCLTRFRFLLLRISGCDRQLKAYVVLGRKILFVGRF